MTSKLLVHGLGTVDVIEEGDEMSPREEIVMAGSPATTEPRAGTRRIAMIAL
jgi:hypothetical protein